MARLMIRLCDIILSLVLLTVLAIPMLVIALAILIDDRGPPIFRQLRVGRKGKTFTILKFRTMRVDETNSGSGATAGSSDTMLAAHRRFQRTVPGDARITRLGHILRPSHLDELPQIMNILLGDMSFVGVRPDTPVQELDYEPSYWATRHRHRPGLTGPAQLRTDPLTFEQRSAEELTWIEGYGLKSYFSILGRTAAKVMKRSSF